MKTILFVCTGNIFRSLIAEQVAKKYIKDNNIKGLKIMSAGITARKQRMYKKTAEMLHGFGIKRIRHKQKKLTKEMLKKSDFVIAMGKNHIEHIKNMGYKAVLFNYFAFGKNKPIKDIWEEVEDYKTNRAAVEKKIEKTALEIKKGIPKIIKKVLKQN